MRRYLRENYNINGIDEYPAHLTNDNVIGVDSTCDHGDMFLTLVKKKIKSWTISLNKERLDVGLHLATFFISFTECMALSITSVYV